MSSHREAPEISKDPVADNADTYAFVSPDKPDTVTIITNYVPLQAPPGGRTSSSSATTSSIRSTSTTTATRSPTITYQFQFNTVIGNPNTFLYNTGPISSLTDPNWNKRQFFTCHAGRVAMTIHVLAEGLACPPCNIGPRSTPNYAALADAAVHTLSSGEVVFAGQRNDPFFVDLGSIFDLGDLRPFQNLHLIPTAATSGVDATKALNIHTIAIQVPISGTDKHRRGSGPTRRDERQGRCSGSGLRASRRKVRIADAANDELSEAGPWVQVSRLGNPLFNEVLVPLGQKDRLERQSAGRRRGLRGRRPASRAWQAAAGALPGRVPEPGGFECSPRRPCGDPA